jgi:hypothetical protein
LPSASRRGSRSWRSFLRALGESILAYDFLTVETLWLAPPGTLGLKSIAALKRSSRRQAQPLWRTPEEICSLRSSFVLRLDRSDLGALGSRLHRARDASRLKSSPTAVRGSRKAEGGKSAGTVDESATGSVNPFAAGFDALQ